MYPIYIGPPSLAVPSSRPAGGRAKWRPVAETTGFFFRVSFLPYIHCSMPDSATISDLAGNPLLASAPLHPLPSASSTAVPLFALSTPVVASHPVTVTLHPPRRSWSTQETALFFISSFSSPFSLYLLPFFVQHSPGNDALNQQRSLATISSRYLANSRSFLVLYFFLFWPFFF